MKKEELASVLAGIMVLILIYLFWFTEAKKLPFWGKFFAWIFSVGAVARIGYALGKEDETQTPVQQ